MTKIQSHAECSHASSKTARAKCRRDRAKMADDFSSVAAEFGNVQMGTAEFVAPDPVFEPGKYIGRTSERDRGCPDEKDPADAGHITKNKDEIKNTNDQS